MIINKDIYECPKCRELYFFNTAKKPYTTNCPNCKCGLIFVDNVDCDTERTEKVKNTPSYSPTKDPKSPYYIPIIECPYCHSTNTKKISATSKAGNVALFGIFATGKVSKNFHCNSCRADF